MAVHIAERDALLTAYPNPASDEITLVYDGSNSMADIEVHDELGRSVFTVAHSTTGRAVINVASLPTGVYTVVLTINGVQDRTRIVVHH